MRIEATIRYTKIRQIATNDAFCSEVFLIDEPQLGNAMVAKEVEKPHFRLPTSDFFNEARIMFSSACPNVVPIQYACETEDRICLVMPYYRNGSLADRIKVDPISPREAVRVGIGILSGLASIHDKGLIHFDVKPSNVLFSDTDEPMVADFGQARRVDANGTSAVPPVYMFGEAPEFATMKIGTVLSDLYHVGLLLYRAINGDRFYVGQIPRNESEIARLTAAGKLPDRSAFMPHVPKRMRTIIRRALAVDPARRYQSAPEFSSELAKTVVDLDWVTTSQPDGTTTWKATRPDRTDLVVELVQRGSFCDVCVWTDNNGSKRAKDPSSFKRNGISRPEAEAHLKRVFENL
ncbi:Protein kinase [Sorangium cellulosum So ce56]|uniref:Protein kinase n=1 Tax=Sorangium cellulosum (strain So ce56) TaxID=448385 RepID=A9GLQ3_SORC5|nr:serine/threonine-protein kinase [Sorangium cellulosum]CAN90307.1 Protein kinase [Sorangium cellulosum So ce56]